MEGIGVNFYKVLVIKSRKMENRDNFVLSVMSIFSPLFSQIWGGKK